MIAEAAIEWDRAVRVAKVLKEQRDVIECDAVMAYAKTPIDFDQGGTFASPEPHWKARTYDSVRDEMRTVPISEWCPSCRQRRQLHEAYRRATKARGARLRTLRRYTAATISPCSIRVAVERQLIEVEELAKADARASQ